MEAYCRLTPDGYREKLECASADTVAPAALPSFTLQLKSVFE